MPQVEDVEIFHRTFSCNIVSELTYTVQDTAVSYFLATPAQVILTMIFCNIENALNEI